MSGSTQRKLRSKIICERTVDDVSEGTSARTRPLSYDEVMLKRKSKKEQESNVEEAHEAETTRREEIIRNRDHQSKDTNGAAMKNSRDHLRESSPRKKVEKSFRLDHFRSKFENKDGRDVDSRSRHKHVNDVKNVNESKNDRQHIRSNAQEHLRGDARYSNENDHRDSSAQDRYVERNGGASEKENKKRDRSGGDEKYRMRDPVKKHDSGRRRDFEISEGREMTEPSHSRHDDTKAKRRRSRSQERTKEKARRSSTSSPKARKIGLDHVPDQGELSLHSERDRSRRYSGVDRSKAMRPSSPSPKAQKNGLDHVHDQHELSSHVERDKSRRHSDVDRSKVRRSISSSPKARKNVSDHVHAQGELSSRSERDKSRRHSDADRVKAKRSSSSSPKARKNVPDQVHDQGELSSRSERDKSRRQSNADRSKARRSRSSSPKARKNVLDQVQGHDELSSRSERDKSRRLPDVDRNKMSTDGPSSHHRRHGVSSSGLGGYSPRKRKSEAAVKTPSPIRSPERKKAGWDHSLSGSDRNLNTTVASGTQLASQPKPSNMMELAAGFSVAPSMGRPLSAILSNSLSAFKQASIDSVQLTQATRPMRRLYIDNIPGSATEKDIIECFNTFLLATGSNHIRGTNPCISCMINKEKGQALVEFLTPEDASAALSFDGRSLSGSILKIRRPKDFVEAPARLSGSSRESKVVEESMNEVVISDFVKDSPHKIFVGGIAEGLSSEMIMEIFSSFGTLKAYRFKVNEDLKEPCAFLEYADQSVTLKACAGLNGMKIGGRVLTVSQALPNAASLEIPGSRPFYGIPEHVKPLLEMPTQVLKLKNVLDQKILDLLSETDLEEILEDVRLECSRFGSVVSINAVRGGNLPSVSEEKEVTYVMKSIQPPEENQHMNVDPIEVSVDHDGGDGSNEEPLINTEELDAVDCAEGDGLEVAHATASPDVEARDSGISTVEHIKEADKTLPQNCDDSTDNDLHEATVIGLRTIDDMGRVNDSEGYHHEAVIQDSGVSFKLNPNGSLGTENSGNDEILCAEDVSELGKNDDTVLEIVPLPTKSAAAEKGPNNENRCDDKVNLFEIGCVLVEFRRTEASCMAAHCLHGRAFDDRIVTVEYVPLDAYRERFPK